MNYLLRLVIFYTVEMLEIRLGAKHMLTICYFQCTSVMLLLKHYFPTPFLFISLKTGSNIPQV